MKYLDVINNCKLKIDNEFKEFAAILKENEFFSDLHCVLSSSSFVNEFQLVDSILSFYIPGLDSDENGIEIAIGLFQIRKTNAEGISYRSKIEYDSNGDLVFQRSLYVTSDICTTTGAFIIRNSDYEINTDDVYFFEKDLNEAIDSIFVSFRAKTESMSMGLSEIKKRNGH